jgi:ABC-type nickel/cobalt efflux system permease component RcnA
VLLLSVVVAAGLGAAHALTPGHGKTLMAAYLVGTRGRPVHAVGLGLAVSVSHTLGIVALAAVAVGAADALPPDLLVRVAPIVAAVSIVAVGAWMVAGEIQRRWATATSDRSGHEHGEEHEHELGDVPEHAQEHELGDVPEHARGDRRGHGHEQGHGHGHGHVHGRRHGLDHEHGHGHDTDSHTHALPAGSTITWRGLFALGLAGGLIPSTSALFILLGAIAAGRPTFGFVLVAAFGLGMAAVMVAIGLILVIARERLDRIPTADGFRRVRASMPLAASLLVFAVGIVLTAQALGSSPAL